MKKCLLIGCSNGIPLHKQFSKFFGSKDVEWINLSASGFGNRYITSRLFEYVDEYGIPDYVYLQYSGLSRIDLPFDLKMTVPDYKFQSKTNRRNWVASGGRNGSWLACDMLKKLFAYMYDITSEKSPYDLSLHEIFRGIELCKTLKIPYNWSSYYDYTNPPNKITTIDGSVSELPDYIDMSGHIGESPLNVAYELGDIPDDGVHYTNHTSEQFILRNKDKFNL
jgi:hypothetical protein|tara:strand:- start:941 stop:1609 length:669 start_codon:yes stop_codon:yes gene_type:complete